MVFVNKEMFSAGEQCLVVEYKNGKKVQAVFIQEVSLGREEGTSAKCTEVEDNCFYIGRQSKGLLWK